MASESKEFTTDGLWSDIMRSWVDGTPSDLGSIAEEKDDGSQQVENVNDPEEDS